MMASLTQEYGLQISFSKYAHLLIPKRLTYHCKKAEAIKVSKMNSFTSLMLSHT